MKKGTIKQILLITDGCSNQGEDPSAMAALSLRARDYSECHRRIERMNRQKPEGITRS